jgi:hypothetical protein
MRARIPVPLQGPVNASGQKATHEEAPLGEPRVARIVDKMLHNLWLVGCPVHSQGSVLTQTWSAN